MKRAIKPVQLAVVDYVWFDSELANETHRL